MQIANRSAYEYECFASLIEIKIYVLFIANSTVRRGIVQSLLQTATEKSVLINIESRSLFFFSQTLKLSKVF